MSAEMRAAEMRDAEADATDRPQSQQQPRIANWCWLPRQGEEGYVLVRCPTAPAPSSPPPTIHVLWYFSRTRGTYRADEATLEDPRVRWAASVNQGDTLRDP